MVVLYRKYRPQTFSEVLNQKPIIETLKNQVKSGSVAHAYLFTGSRGVGKTSVARILAKAINCLDQKDGEACGVCGNCKAIAGGSFLDLVEIDAASNTGVDNIRELIEHVKFSPSSGKYKVFIIDEVHMLSKGAFNALLKTLEEPPAHAVFILATTEINKVPATIVSRTQRFDFKALSVGDLLSHLEKVAKEEKINFSVEVLNLVAQASEGSVRDSLSLLDKLLTLGNGATLEQAQALLGVTDIAVCENLLELISSGKAENLSDFFDSLLEKGLDFKIFNRDFLEYLRKALVYKISGQHSGLPPEHLDKLKACVDKLSAQDIMFIVRLFLRSYKELDSAPSAHLPLLLAAIEAALRKTVSSPTVKIPDSNALKSASEEKVASHHMPIKPPAAESVTQPVLEPEAVAVSLAEVEIFWPKVIANIKEINNPLSSLVKKSVLTGVFGNKIVLGVKFLFDKQNLENLKNAGIITAAIQNVSGKKIGISAQVIKEDVADAASPSLGLTEALKVFGGELVE